MFLRWSYMFFVVVALLLTTPLAHAQESTVNQKSEYLQRDDLGADYNTAIEKLHEAANKLNELESALSVSLTNTEGQVDKLRPASCEFIDQKLSWDGTQWVCSDDVNEELEWYASSGWSGCSASCGGGTMSRSIGCRMKIAGTVVGTSYCTNLAANSRPSSSQSCNTQACTAAWSVGGWSSCSASCGGGVQTRSVSCPSGYVCTGSRPSSSQSCNTQACAPVMSGCAGGSNSVGSWPATSHGQTIYGTCAAGTSGTFRGYCNNGSASVTINTCASTAPTPTTGAWTAGGWSAWSSCSKSCGSGTQSRTRSVTCNYSSCTGSKPSTSESRACNTQACASANCSAGTVQLRICSVSVSAIANGSSQHHSCLSPSRGTECAGMVRCNNGVLSASGVSCVQQCIAGPGRCF